MWKCDLFYMKNHDVVYCKHLNSPELEYCIVCGFTRDLDIPHVLALRVHNLIYQCNICLRYGVRREELQVQTCHHCSGPISFRGYVWKNWKCDYTNPIDLKECTECDTCREMTFVKQDFMLRCELCNYKNPFTSENCYQYKTLCPWILNDKPFVPQIWYLNFERKITNGKCPICFIHFDATKYIANSPCGHAVFKQYLQTWIDELDTSTLHHDPKCPYCKDSFELEWFVQVILIEFQWKNWYC